MPHPREGGGTSQRGQDMIREAEQMNPRQTEQSVFSMTLRILTGKWRSVMAVWIAAGILSVIVAFLLPKQYTTESVFQVETGGGSLKLPLPEGLKMLDPKFKSSGTGITLAILDSRKLALTMVDAFDLRTRYRTKWEHQAIKRFRNDFESEVFDEGIIKIKFTYPSRDSVKIIADSIISFINKESIEYSTNKAKFEYQFNKAIFDSVMHEIDSLSQVGIEFLNRVGIVDFERHVDLSLKTYSKLQETLLGLESEYAVAKVENQKTPTELRGLQEMIGILKKKERDLTQRRTPKSRKQGYSFGIDYDSVPAMGVYLEKLNYLVEKDKMIMKVMIPKLEDSRLRMIETTPMLNIIDPTYVPPYKSGPKRVLIMLLITFLIGGAYIACVIVWQLLYNPIYTTRSLQQARTYLSSIK